MMVEITKELTESEENKDVTSYEVLQWARQVEAQTRETAVLIHFKAD